MFLRFLSYYILQFCSSNSSKYDASLLKILMLYIWILSLFIALLYCNSTILLYYPVVLQYYYPVYLFDTVLMWYYLPTLILLRCSYYLYCYCCTTVLYYLWYTAYYCYCRANTTAILLNYCANICSISLFLCIHVYMQRRTSIVHLYFAHQSIHDIYIHIHIHIDT